MRLLITGADGLLGSNLAAAAAQQSWDVLGGSLREPVEIAGARTTTLDTTDRLATLHAATSFEPDVLVHAAGSTALTRFEHEPYLAQLQQLGVAHTLAAAREVRAHYVLVSCDCVFSGHRPPGQRWSEEDRTDPVNAYGRSKRAAEEAVRETAPSFLITRLADVYGVNLARSTRADALAAHVWGRSGIPLRLLARLRDARPLPAPAGLYRSPTYAWDYAQRLCELVAQECEGVYHMGGPESLHRRDYLRMLARAFDCDPELVRDGTVAAFLHALGEDPRLRLPANTTLDDEKATFVIGHGAVDVQSGHALMREQLRRALDPRAASLAR